jgi:predicted phage terminase large subunit-like protein
MTLNLQYTENQLNFLFNYKEGAKFIIVPCGRRWGKTKGAANGTIEWMIEGQKLLWGDTISSNIDRYIDRYFKPELKASGIKYNWSSQKKLLELPDFGGYMDFRSADRPENWEGFGYDKIILNEAGIILKNDYLYTNAVLPMLMDRPNSKLFAIGTPKGKKTKQDKEHRYYSMYKRAISGDPSFDLFQFSSYDNPFLSNEDVKALEDEMRLMNPQMVRQEIYAEFVDGAAGELWDEVIIERQRVDVAPDLKRITVNIDPAISSNAESDETGITVTGKDSQGNGYVLDDDSGQYSPEQWARTAIRLVQKWGADSIVAERNQGGDMVESVLRSAGYQGRVKLVTATKGKFVRAEPVYAYYEQGKVFHVGHLPKLEAQMCSFSSDLRNSPDRVDSLVWGLTELMLSQEMFFF